MIVIVDYDMGNLNSVEKALELACFNIGIKNQIKISKDKTDILSADSIILPGVGAFGSAVANLKKYDLIDTLKVVSKSKPFLGICLGFQLMFDKSYEDGEFEGLGLVKGEVKKFNDDKLKIPHMGWNSVEGKYYYFVHSYYVDIYEKKFDGEILYCDYGIKFCAGIKKQNIWGVQFHPEKSQENGIKLLEKFLIKEGIC